MMIKVTNLYKKYPTSKDYVLKNINLEFNNSGMFFIVGKSGSGKSTLINILSLLDSNFEGELSINDQNIKELSEEKRENLRFSLMSNSFQQAVISDYDSVYCDLKNILYLTNNDEVEIKNVITSHLERFGLRDRMNTLGKNLSGGEKKLVSLIKSVILKPQILFLDEPTAGVDDEHIGIVLKFLEEYSKDHLVIVITHNPFYKKYENVIYIKDGEIKSVSYKNEKNIVIIKKNRTKLKLKVYFQLAFQNIKNHLRTLLISLSSFNVALLCVGFIFVLLSGVNSGIVNSLGSSLTDNSVMMGHKSDILINPDNRNLSVKEVESISTRLSDHVMTTGIYYETEIDSMFDIVEFYIETKNHDLDLTGLKLENINKFSNTYFLDEPLTLSNDEIVLEVPQNMLSIFLNCFHVKNVYDFDNLFETNKVYLNMEIENEEWNYVFHDYSPRIRRIIFGDSYMIYHSNSAFNKYFFEDELQLDSSHVYGENDSPWFLLNTGVITVKNDNLIDFYVDFMADKMLSEFTFSIVRKEKEFSTIKVMPKSYQDLSSKVIEEVQFSNRNIISYSINNSIYTSGGNDLFTGFNKNIFLSNKLDELNAIVDDNSYSEENLFSFQLNDIKVSDDVVKGSLLGNTDNNNVIFDSNLDVSTIIDGEIFTDSNEVVISKSLANKLNISLSEIDTINGIILSNIETLSNDKFHNIFDYFQLKVVGITDEERYVFYQNPYFLGGLLFAYSELDNSSYLTDSVLFTCRENTNKEVLKSLIDLYGDDYYFEIPLLDMKNNIKSTISYIVIGLSIFAVISSVISVFLINSSLLFISEINRRKNEILMIYGYKQKDIFKVQQLLLGVICLFSFITSSIGTSILNIVVNKALFDELGANVGFNFLPYLIVFIVTIISFVILTLVMLRNLKREKHPKNRRFK